MASDWIKIEKTTPRKRELLVLAELLQISIGDAFLLCFQWWSWCDENMTECYAPSVTFVTVDAVVGRNGFGTALSQVGWLKLTDHGVEVPNFERHLSKGAKIRSQTARRMQGFRSGESDQSRSERNKSDAASVTSASRKAHQSKKESKSKKIIQNTLHPDWFAEWYAIYPKKVARAKAEAAWFKAVQKVADQQGLELEGGAEMLMRWTRERMPGIEAKDSQYRQHPASWLNGECYLDEIERPKSRVAELTDPERMNWTP